MPKEKKEKMNITGHILVPKHTKISEDEVRKLLEKYNIGLKQLPRIVKKDPALEALDVKPGDVIKIERQSPTVGKTFFYRVVVNG